MSIWSLDRYSPEGRRSIRLDAAAGAIALALLLLIAVDFSAPLRLVLALLFTFYVPGRAIVSNWPRVERWSGVGMSIVFSLGVLTLLATLTLWAGLWHPLTLFLAESLASLAALAFGLTRRRKDGGDRAAHPVPAHAAGAGPAETLSPSLAAEDRLAEASAWPRGEARLPSFQPRQPEEGGQTETTPRPPAAESWPQAEEPKPQAEEPKPQAEEPKPQAEEPKPQAEEPKPQAEEKRTEELTWPAAEDRVPRFQPRHWPADTPGETPADQPAEDRLPEISPWLPAEDGHTEA